MTVVERAEQVAAAGWHVFPLCRKVPALRKGFSLPFRPVLSSWADPHLTSKTGARWRLSEGKEGSYWATRDTATIEALYYHAKHADGVGIVSDLLLIDIDDPALIPPDMTDPLGRLPHMPTPGGGMHYIAQRLPGDDWKTGGLHTEDGVHFGDLKHLAKSYSVAYDGLPAYSDCSATLDPRLSAWLAERRAQRPKSRAAPAADVPSLIERGVLGPRGGVWLTRFSAGGRTDPEALRGVARGRHDIMLNGTRQDAAHGVNRKDEWVDAMTEAGRDPVTAEREVDAAIEGAERLAVTEADLRRELSETQAALAAAKAQVAHAEAEATAARAVVVPGKPHFKRDWVGLTEGGVHLDYKFGNAADQLLLKPPGEGWKIVRRGSVFVDVLLGTMRRKCLDEAGNEWLLQRRFEWQAVAEACFFAPPVPIEDAFAWRREAVTDWANQQNRGYFSSGHVAHKSGIADRNKGGENLTREEQQIVKAGLEAADGEWDYKDKRLPSGSHSRRWHCPRQHPVKMAPGRAPDDRRSVRTGRTHQKTPCVQDRLDLYAKAHFGAYNVRTRFLPARLIGSGFCTQPQASHARVARLLYRRYKGTMLDLVTRERPAALPRRWHGAGHGHQDEAGRRAGARDAPGDGGDATPPRTALGSPAVADTRGEAPGRPPAGRGARRGSDGRQLPRRRSHGAGPDPRGAASAHPEEELMAEHWYPKRGAPAPAEARRTRGGRRPAAAGTATGAEGDPDDEKGLSAPGGSVMRLMLLATTMAVAIGCGEKEPDIEALERAVDVTEELLFDCRSAVIGSGFSGEYLEARARLADTECARERQLTEEARHRWLDALGLPRDTYAVGPADEEDER